MLRPILVIGLFTIAGMFVLSLAFGLFRAVFGIALMLLFLAIKVAIVGGIVYLIIRIVSPETARRLRERFSGPQF